MGRDIAQMGSGRGPGGRWRPGSADGSVGMRVASLAVALALTFALTFARVTNTALALSHPHVNKPASVARASDREVVAGGDNLKVTHWQFVNPFKLGDYHRVHAKKVSYVTTWLNPTGVNDPNNPNKLFQASYDGTVMVSKLGNFGNANMAQVTEFAHPVAAPNTPDVEVWCVAPSPDGNFAVSGTNYGEIKLWETRPVPVNQKAKERGSLAGADSFYPVGGLVFRPNRPQGQNMQVLASHDGGELVLYDLTPPPANNPNGDYTLTEVKRFSHGNELAVNCVAVTSDGNTAVSCGFDMTVHVWDLATLQEKTGPMFPNLPIVGAHQNIVWRVAISPDDKMIATACDDGKVRLFNMDGTAVMENGAPAYREEVDNGQHLGIMGVTFMTRDTVVYTVGKDPPNPNTPNVKAWDVSALNNP